MNLTQRRKKTQRKGAGSNVRGLPIFAMRGEAVSGDGDSLETNPARQMSLSNPSRRCSANAAIDDLHPLFEQAFALRIVQRICPLANFRGQFAASCFLWVFGFLSLAPFHGAAFQALCTPIKWDFMQLLAYEV
jgi:hypothetical protein